MQRNVVKAVVVAGVLLAWWAGEVRVPAATLESICRVKGQEENTLIGEGLVVGLNGTGEGGSSPATAQALARIMQRLGTRLGDNVTAELKDAKNVARVFVTVTIPARGARQGDRLDCVVSAPAAKSLEGGRLLFPTPMVGPENPEHPRVYGFAGGPITLDDADMPNSGRIRRGCRLEEDFLNAFSHNGKITLVLDPNYAGFQLAQHVADVVNGHRHFLLDAGQQSSSQNGFLRRAGQQSSGQSGLLRRAGQQSGSQDGFLRDAGLGDRARALDQVNIEVMIPEQYMKHQVQFVSEILALEMDLAPPTGACVVINERAGAIVITGDVEIGDVAVTHKNIVVDTGQTGGGGRFAAIAPMAPGFPETPAKLKELVEALNAVHAPTEDIIEIIKRIHQAKKLPARLIIE